MKNSLNRASRRQEQTLFKKLWKSRSIVQENEAFKRIKSELEKKGWDFREEHINLVEVRKGKHTLTSSPSLKLQNEVYNITLVPHSNGIEISRLEVLPHYQCQGYAGKMLDSLIKFLFQNGIYDVYLIPVPAGINNSIFSLDIFQLEKFYFKRGFRKQTDHDYWKLDIIIYSNYIGNDEINSDLLFKGYSPKEGLKSKGKKISLADYIQNFTIKSWNTHRA